MTPRCPGTATLLLLCVFGCATPQSGSHGIDPGDRPLRLAEQLPGSSELRRQLLACRDMNWRRSDFAIAHRGAPLGFAEHTAEGYRAAAAMGAGLIECDVTFTRDEALVCRHSQCDLHRTTNILKTPLAARCRKPFVPAGPDGAASAECCTSDISLAEFRTLCGRPDVVDASATNVDEYLTPLVSPVNDVVPSCGKLMTHAESIALFDTLGVKFVPELKAPMVPMPFGEGLTQAAYATRLIDEYRAAGIDPARVFPQSFNQNDVVHWIEQHPEFAANAVYLDGRGRNPDFEPTRASFDELRAQGFTIVAPPMPLLLVLDEEGTLQPSPYAINARAAGLEIITWTFEAGAPLDPNNFMYANVRPMMTSEGRMLEVLHALHTKARVRGVFTDWAGTVSYYANCFDL